MKQKIKIAIADDHELVTQSFALALKSDPRLEVVALAKNGKQLLDLIAKKKPHIILLDLEMPIMDGWETLNYLKNHKSTYKVIVVSMYFQRTWIKELSDLGARGFLPKSANFETLTNAIHEVHNLGFYFSEKNTKKIVRKLVQHKSLSNDFQIIELSELEIQALKLICKDKGIKEIADSLHVSIRTAERTRVALYDKTKTKTPAGLFLFALKNQLVLAP